MKVFWARWWLKKIEIAFAIMVEMTQFKGMQCEAKHPGAQHPYMLYQWPWPLLT